MLARKGLVPAPDATRLLSPCLPNRFLAFVPWGHEAATAHDLARKCNEACRKEWRTIAAAVRAALDSELRLKQTPHIDDWDRLWESQTESLFEVRTAVLPLNACDDQRLGCLLSPNGDLRDALPDAFRVRDLAGLLPAGDRPGYRQDSAGRWMGAIDLLARLVEAGHARRHVPDYEPEPDGNGAWPAKCSLLGTYEQMGPAVFGQARAFWEAVARNVQIRGTRISKGDRLAVSLVKRFAWPACFALRFDLDVRELRYNDTATVAARGMVGQGRRA